MFMDPVTWFGIALVLFGLFMLVLIVYLTKRGRKWR